MPIFSDVRDFKRFIKVMLHYQIAGEKPRYSLFDPEIHMLDNEKKTVEIIAYCLMPNHFHFLLKQIQEGGLTEFVGKLTNSYTRYYNTRHKRVGPLFQGEFKAVHVENDEQFLYLSRYIHLNPSVGFIVKHLDDYLWSSYHEYVNNAETNICSKRIVLDQFHSSEDYRQFVLDHEDYGKQLEIIKHLLLDDN